MNNPPIQFARHDKMSNSLSKKIPSNVYNKMSNPPTQLARHDRMSNSLSKKNSLAPL